MLPIVVGTGRLCTGPLGGISVPGLPAKAALGTLDATGCVAAPAALHQTLADLPAGSAVVIR